MTQLYLSRLTLNPRDRAARRDLADPYDLHRTVMSGFPAELPGDERVLYRLEEGDGARPFLLVQSTGRPDWSALPPGYLRPADPFDPQPNPAVKEVDPAFRPGQVLRFRLRANPTVKKVRRDETGARRNSNRVPLLREEEQLAWLAARAAPAGFRLLDGRVGAAARQRSRHKGITLYTVQFDGLLQVADADDFRAGWREGIGPARAFGCGLLSLAPA